MTTLLEVLNDDVWTTLARVLALSDTGAVARTCRTWRRVISLPHIDYIMAQSYAENVLKDECFWRNASMRPVQTRNALPTFRLEIKRIEEFKKTGGMMRLAACELYPLWNFLDARGHPPVHPPRSLGSKGTPGA